MIFTDRIIMVQKGTSSINDTIILYRGDKEVEIRFTLNEGSPFRFGSGASPNIIEKTEAAYGQLIIKRPNDLPAVFSEIAPTNEGKIVFTITAEMIDEITEVGNYTFQIRLLDESRNSRATLPEVVDGIEIREPIASEDTTNEVGEATVGYTLTTAGVSEDAFDGEGNYNKTTWGTGDRITAAELNKMENGIYTINNKVKENTTDTNTARQDISDIKLQIGTEELTTTSKEIKGAINDLSSQIKDKANKNEVRDKNTLISINDVDSEFLTAIQGGTSVEVNSVPKDGSVTYDKLSTDVKNICLDGAAYVKGLYYDSSLTSTLSNSLYIPDKPLKNRGIIDKIKLNVQNNCTAKILVLKKNSDTSFTILSITDINATIGEKEYEVNIEVPYYNLYIGIKGTLYYANGATGENCSSFYESNSSLVTGNDIITKKDTGAANKQFGIQFDILQISGLKKEINTLKERIDNLKEEDIDNFKILNMPRYLIENNKDTSFLFNCYYLGRWIKKRYNDVDYMYTINHGSEILAKVSNTSTITMKFGDNCNRNGSKHVLAYSVDGEEFIRDTVDKGSITINGLDTKEHYIRIVVAGIADQNWLWTVDQGFYFGGLEVDEGGIIEPVRPKNRIAYFYGDSITAGCWLLGANDGVNNVTTPANAAEQNYVMECCNRLNLANVRIGFSGSGVLTAGRGSVPKCIEWIDKLNNYTNENTQDKPDFICINLGQNDSDNGFKIAYQECIDRLQRKYPGVIIFIIIPFSQKHRTDLIDIANNNKNTVIIDTEGWNISLNDSAHPNRKGSIVAGDNLAKFLLNYFGRLYFII